jgi:hypothetical protein
LSPGAAGEVVKGCVTSSGLVTPLPLNKPHITLQGMMMMMMMMILIYAQGKPQYSRPPEGYRDVLS